MRMTWAYCPICGKSARVSFLAEEFVAKHLHPIRKYWYNYKNNRNYDEWLKGYYADVEKYKKMTPAEQENKRWIV